MKELAEVLPSTVFRRSLLLLSLVISTMLEKLGASFFLDGKVFSSLTSHPLVATGKIKVGKESVEGS